VQHFSYVFQGFFKVTILLLIVIFAINLSKVQKNKYCFSHIFNQKYLENILLGGKNYVKNNRKNNKTIL